MTLVTIIRWAFIRSAISGPRFDAPMGGLDYKARLRRATNASRRMVHQSLLNSLGVTSKQFDGKGGGEYVFSRPMDSTKGIESAFNITYMRAILSRVIVRSYAIF